MKLMDIHSHILPAVDDGAKDVETSIEILKMMKAQGITNVIATPHFDASMDNIEEFTERVAVAKAELEDAKKGLDLPEVLVGSEVYYFNGIGHSNGIRPLTLGGSKYILLELRNQPFENEVIRDVNSIFYDLGLVPIFAHVERYAGEKGFKALLNLISSGLGYAQVNAASLVTPPFKKIVHKLIKHGNVSFIATDSHSVEGRPPMMDKALDEVRKSFGEDYCNIFIKNTDFLYNEIVG